MTVNDSVIYSKLSTMNFPTISIFKGIDGGSEPKQVEKMAEGQGCTINFIRIFIFADFYTMYIY